LWGENKETNNIFSFLDYFAFYLVTPVLVDTSKPKADHGKLLKEPFMRIKF
jgi:hypothetical protein